MSGRSIIHTANLVKTYGDLRAVNGIDLDLEEGRILGLIGPSGCGKTTLIRMLTGIVDSTRGEISVLGRDPSKFTTADRMSFGYMPQLPVLFPNLSVWNNLNFVSSIYGIPFHGRRKRLHEVLRFVDLDEHRHTRLADCSGGMQRRLTLAATLVHSPRLLFMDEPTAGIDPILRERFWAHFRELRNEGRSLVVSTQYVGEAVSCDLVAVMAEGRLLTVQRPEDLAHYAYDGQLIKVELGQAWISAGEIARLEANPQVLRVRRSEDALQLVVEDAQRDIAAVREFFDLASYDVLSVELAEVNYDDVFVAIVKADQRGQAHLTEPAPVAS